MGPAAQVEEVAREASGRATAPSERADRPVYRASGIDAWVGGGAALLALALLGLTLQSKPAKGPAVLESPVGKPSTEAAVDTIRRALGTVRAQSLRPDPAGKAGASSLHFQRLEDFSAHGIVWSPACRVAWQFAPGEQNNGIDDNADGLADEGEVVLTMESGGTTQRVATLGSHVAEYLEGEWPNGLDDNGNGLIDEKGLSFERKDDVLLLRLTTLERNAQGISVAVTRTRTIKLEM